MAKKVEIYDTTCRDGGQDPLINLSLDDKRDIIHSVDAFGADFIEVGFALNNEKENELYKELKPKLKNSKLAAFGSTAHPKNIDSVEKDAGMMALVATGADYATIFGKSWEEHITNQLKISKEKNLELIKKTVEFLTSMKIEVIYDAEHFFSGFFDDEKYALKTLKAAIDGGAKRIVLCDTKGGCIPKDIRLVAKKIKEEFEDNKKIVWGFHGHNDSGCSTANSLEFIDNVLGFADIVHIQGTFNGYGERAGNAPINVLAADIKFKMKIDLPKINFKELTKISEEIAFAAKKQLHPHTPYAGRYAFAHKAGVHIHGERSGASYNHIDPALIGNETRYLLTSQAGRDAMIWFSKQFGYGLDKGNPKTLELLEKAKELSRQGYDLNISDAVGRLFMLDHYEKRQRVLHFEDLETSSYKQGDKKYGNTQLHKGSIRDKNGKLHKIIRTGILSEGGPVDSQFKVIKKVVSKHYPKVKDVEMVFFETDIPPIKNGKKEYSKSKVLTIISFANLNERWTTIGLDENRDIASFDAIVNGFEYLISQDEEK